MLPLTRKVVSARMDFRSAYRHGFLRVAACTLTTAIGDPAANAASVLRVARECADEGVGLAVFPELTLTGYSIEDILLQDTLLDAAEARARRRGRRARPSCCRCSWWGAAAATGTGSYNVAAVVHRGRLLGVVPKSYLPNYREFYERRQFAPGDDAARHDPLVAGVEVPFGPDLLFAADDVPGLRAARRDLRGHVGAGAAVARRRRWPGRPCWPTCPAARSPSAGPTTASCCARSASSRCLAAYVYAAAGEGESTTDLAWDGQTMIYENGVLLAETERFPKGERTVGRRRRPRPAARRAAADGHLRRQPPRTTPRASTRFRTVGFRLDPPAADIGLRREVERFPFVPADPARLEQDCYEAYNIQVAGLEQRLRAIGNPKVVIGVSGGLDSTHALIVAARAMDRVGRPRSDILGFTMPGFATGDAHQGQRAAR